MFEEMAKLAGAVTREVRNAEREGKPVRVVVAARDYDTGIDDSGTPSPAPNGNAGSRQSAGVVLAGATRSRATPGNHAASRRARGMDVGFGPATSWVVALSPAGESIASRHIAPVDPHWRNWRRRDGRADLGLMGLARHTHPAAEKPPEADPAWLARPRPRIYHIEQRRLGRWRSPPAVMAGLAARGGGIDAQIYSGGLMHADVLATAAADLSCWRKANTLRARSSR